MVILGYVICFALGASTGLLIGGICSSASGIPFFAFPEGVRKIIYTTNAIEALNSKLRRAIRTRGHFPSDDAAAKLLYLVLNHAAADWKRPPREWFEAKTQFAVMFKERFVLA